MSSLPGFRSPFFAHRFAFQFHGYTALFLKAAELFRDLAVARADGSHGKLLDRLSRLDLLIVDDWAMAPMTEAVEASLPLVCPARFMKITS